MTPAEFKRLLAPETSVTGIGDKALLAARQRFREYQSFLSDTPGPSKPDAETPGEYADIPCGACGASLLQPGYWARCWGCDLVTKMEWHRRRAEVARDRCWCCDGEVRS